MARDYDEVLEAVGSYGPYQKWRVALILSPVSCFVGFTMNVLLFQTVVPEHWCHVPGRQNTTLSQEEWKALTLPKSKESAADEYESCQMYKVEWSEADQANFSVSNDTQECSNGWEHDQSQFSETVATSYGWLCDRRQYSHHVLSLSMAGNAVGTFLFSLIADYLGRRKTFYLVLLVYVVATIIVVWVPYIGLHVTLRFIQGLSSQSNYLLPYIIVLEMIPPDQRALIIMLTFQAWTMGMCFTALMAWLIPNWKHLALVSCIPSILGFCYWRYLPESPRWLLSKGRVRECADILFQIAATNGTPAVSRAEVEAELRQISLTQPKDLPITHVLSYPRLRMRAAILYIQSFCTFTVYGVVLLGINVMPNNYFLSHFILSASEIPSSLVGWVMADYLGRRVMGWITFILTAIFCAVAPFCTHDKWLLVFVMAAVKFFVTQGVYIVFLMTSELFPTPIRTSGIGLMVVFGMLAMGVSPYILYSEVSSTIQYWVMLALTLVCLVASIPLPETLGLNLPQTFLEAEDQGSDRPFTTWIHHWNKHKYPTPARKLLPDSGPHLLQQQQQKHQEANALEAEVALLRR